jgi:hypothetical protein
MHHYRSTARHLCSHQRRALYNKVLSTKWYSEPTCCPRERRTGTPVAARWRAIPTISQRWPSRQTGSWSRRHPETRQYGCGRRRQGRVAARWRAIPTMSWRYPSRHVGKSSTLMQAIPLCLYPQLHHHLLGSRHAPPISYCRANGYCATSNAFYGCRLIIDQAAQQYVRI